MASLLKCLPDIIYSQLDDGEILIEWYAETEQLFMLTFVDLTNIYSQKQGSAQDLMNLLENMQHPNLLNIVQPCIMLDNIKTAVFRTEAPDHISTWK